MQSQNSEHIEFQKVVSGFFFIGLGIIPLTVLMIAKISIFSPYGSLLSIVIGAYLYRRANKLEKTLES